MSTYIYARVSTKEQNLKQQIDYLTDKHKAVNGVYSESITGTNMKREQWTALLSVVKAGDTIVVKEMSRIGRSTVGVLDAIAKLNGIGVNLIIDKENIDTNSAQGKFMITVLAGMATMERELMLERQKVGIASAKKEGKYKGRVRNDDKCIRAVTLIEKGLAHVDACKVADVGVSTLYRYLASIKE